MKMSCGKLLILMVLLGLGLALTAQTTPGKLDNYSGSTATWLNPSNMRTTFVYLDLGIASADFVVHNNFAYLPQHTFLPSLRSLLSEGGTWATFEGKQPDKDYYYRYFDPDFEKKRHTNIYESVNVSFPTAMLTIAGRHAVGFSLRHRSYTSIVKSPWEIPVLVTESLEWEPMQHQRFTSSGMRFANMEWSEANLSYAATFLEDGAYKLDAGVTARLMMGVAGFTGGFNTLDYEVLHKDTLYFYDLEGDLNLVAPVDYSVNIRQDPENVFNFTNPFYHGMGFGGDVGLSVTNKKSSMIPLKIKSACEDYPVNYYWRFGLSLIDVGEVHFNANTLSGDLRGEEIRMNLKLFDTVQSVVTLVDLMDSIMENKRSTFTYGSEFAIGLPTAFSMQFDANLYRDFYVNATWIHPVSHLLYREAVEREPLLSVTPRYESVFFGAALPVTLYDYSYVTLGTFLRIGPVHLGTNDLLSLTGISKTRNIDFYIAVRLKLSRGDCLFHPFFDACGDKYLQRSHKKRQK